MKPLSESKHVQYLPHPEVSQPGSPSQDPSSLDETRQSPVAAVAAASALPWQKRMTPAARGAGSLASGLQVEPDHQVNPRSSNMRVCGASKSNLWVCGAGCSARRRTLHDSGSTSSDPQQTPLN